MKKYQNIFLKKVASIALLILLCVIQAVKISHSHKKTYTPNFKAGISTAESSKESVCTICDFQLAKDADCNTHFTAIIPTAAVQITLVAVLPPFLPTAHSFLDDARGPPAVI